MTDTKAATVVINSDSKEMSTTADTTANMKNKVIVACPPSAAVQPDTKSSTATSVIATGNDQMAPKTPVSKNAATGEALSPITPAESINTTPTTKEDEQKTTAAAKEDKSPAAITCNEGAPASDEAKCEEVPAGALKTPAPKEGNGKNTATLNTSPITPEGCTTTKLQQDNEVPTPSVGEKTKLKPLSPTAEPFVMSSNLFPETPKKASVSHMPLNTIDVSGNLPPMTPNRSRGTPRNSSTPVSPNVELSAKQVRELRRLCRKTANRAEYEGRLVQLRQIASILAMGGPSLVHFAPSYLAAHSAMQAWLDAARAGGADWRDERQLSTAAVEELREWDRLLKAWAKRRFPTLADVDGGSAPPTTPRSKRADLMSMTSPVSGNSPSPARALVSAQQGIGSPSSVRNRGGGGNSGSFVQSRMSISTDGDTINVSIVRTPDKASSHSGGKSPWRGASTPRRDQENVHPDSGDSTARDWGSLRKNGSSGVAEGGVVTSTPLKTRNW